VKLCALTGGYLPKTAADADKAKADHTDPTITWVRFEKGDVLTPCAAVARSLLANGFAEEVK